MDDEAIQSGVSGSGKGEDIIGEFFKKAEQKLRVQQKGKDLIANISDEENKTIIQESKIEVEIREVFRISAGDVRAFKNSFEEWAKQWL